MAKGTKSLATLLRLAKFELDGAQRALSACYAEEARIQDAMAQADRRLAEEQACAQADPTEAGAFYGAYQQHWLEQRETHNRHLAQAHERTAAARQVLAEAFREVKTIETAKATREQDIQQEANRKETNVLNEIGQNLHRRRTAESETHDDP